MKTFASLLAFLLLSTFARGDSHNNFSTGVLDYGVVVKDLDASVAFYKSIGLVVFAEFSLPAHLSGDAGLTDYKELPVVMMTATGGEADSKVKLIELPGEHAEQDQTYIDSTYGVSYQTFFVKDINATVKMLQENEIPILAKGPTDLSEVGFTGVNILLIRDPDGNFVEFVGPKL